MIRILLACCCSLALGAADAAPAAIAPGRLECHGSFRGAPFWLRLLPADAQFGGKRLLQLVYTQPRPDELAGAHLADCPFILLDDQLRIVAWNDRDTLSQVLPAPNEAYKVVREIQVGSGEQAAPASEERRLAGPRAWDLRLAPLQLVLAWRAAAPARVRLLDLFGPRQAEALDLSWDAEGVRLAGESLKAEADAEGRLQRLRAADGGLVLEVQGWAPTPAP